MTMRFRNKAATFSLALMAVIFTTVAQAGAQTEIVLHARNAPVVNGNWQVVPDTTAASGARMWNPDRGATKLSAPSTNPSDYFELTFNAEGGRPYRLWLRGKADGDYWGNDSVFVQFSGATSASGAARYGIGTTDAAVVSLEECTGCGTSQWGWNDNGWNGAGPTISFSTTGPQKIRIQRREDGISIDQVVLSPSRYLSTSPGALKNDTALLAMTSTGVATAGAPTSTAPEVVISAAASATLRGDWQVVADTTAAGGARVANPDRRAGKLASASAVPADYFDVTFSAEAGRPYRLWLRGRAENDAWSNDSVFVQFDGSLNAAGAPAYRIGTTDATVVVIQQGDGQALGGWGWSDNGWDSSGPPIYFARTGMQTLRVQRREDGISIDQIVLSSQKYLSTAPGSATYDSTLLTGSMSSGGPTGTAPPVPPPPPPPPPLVGGTPVRLRVLMWNLKHGVGTDGVYNLDRLATWMSRMTPDVIFLVEVERNTGWGNEDQPMRYKAMLEAKTGRRWYSHFAQEFGEWTSNGKGLQILSVYPFDSVGQTTITPSSGLGWAGAVAQASITVNGRPLNLLHTHLDPYDQSMRLTQARDVLAWSTSFAENRILTGDMNAWPDQSSIAEINKTYYDSWATAFANGTSSAPTDISPYGATRNGRIDYIFYSKGAPNLRVVDSRVWETRDANGYMPSDHRPLVTTFEIR